MAGLNHGPSKRGYKNQDLTTYPAFKTRQDNELFYLIHSYHCTINKIQFKEVTLLLLNSLKSDE